MQYLLAILMIVSYVSYSRTLVHYVKMDKGENGCKSTEGTEIEVGQFIQDPNSCGGIRCISKKGDALIMYCQRALPFAECKVPSVSIEIDFPECCWTCVKLAQCTGDGQLIKEKKSI